MPMRFATESTFGRQVLRADSPVLVCFGARSCPGRRALAPALERLAAAYMGRLRVTTLLLDDAPLLAEQFGVAASPTLMLFAHGERQAQAVGFLPEGLLRLLVDDVLAGVAAGDLFWSPVEERFEETALLPLIAGWGFGVQRQAPCALTGPALRGRVDLLLFERPGGPALTLIESKRQIRGESELQAAARQAAGYARSLDLPSFVVAAPRGLWIYKRLGERSQLVRQISSLELHEAPGRVRELLLQLRLPKEPE